MEIIAVTAILAVLLLSFGAMRTYASLVTATSQPQIDVSQVVRDVLDRFVEQSKSTNETITGVYAPVERTGGANGSIQDWAQALESLEPARMASYNDFDDSDPTDLYLKPTRVSAAMIDGGDENPFGIPGLVTVARKDEPLTIADILGTGHAAR
jgi:hypothetical protein